MHSGWRSSGRRLLAIGLGGLGGLGIALSISPAGVVDAIDPSVRTLRNLGFGGAVAFGIVQVLVAVSGVLPASPGGTPTAEPMVCRLPAGGRRIRTLGPTGTILGHLTPLAYAEVRRPCPGPERSKSGSPKRSGRFRSAAKNRVSSRTWPIASFTAYLRRGRATDDTAVRPSLTA
jgi:hypothetical protein